MPNLNYLMRVVRGARFDKMKPILETVKEKSGHSKARTFLSILWCSVRYGAGYYDYAMFGFYAMNGRQRDTYLTRMRNKKVLQAMNDYSYAEEFDDKNRFNKRFAPYLRRRTLNGETATAQELAAFCAGQEAIFAKPNHGDSGRGVEKLRVADFPDAEAMLAYLHEHGLTVLEQVLAQHPQIAALHPSSVNTLRILTDVVGEDVLIAYITLKIGTGGGCCDNAGRGGIMCRVDPEDGRIVSVATDDYFNVYDEHPDTHIRFVGYQLPMIPEAIALAKCAAREIPQMRHVGWDVAITPDGPAIIEGNEYPGTDLCQLAPHYPEKTGLWPYYKKILGI